MNNPSDFARWTENCKVQPAWEGRVRLIASLIPPGSSVLDVGAGAMTLASYLPRDTEYVPMDAVRSSAQTILVDFNAYQVPEISRPYDYAVCSGVMEYIIPIHLLLATVARWARTVILSYAVVELNPEGKARQRNGWLNHLSDKELRLLFSRQGLTVKCVIPWERQLVYILDSSSTLHSIYQPPQPERDRADVASVFRYDPTNAGDYFCAPFRYFNFGSLRCVDILGLGDPASLPPKLIVGGGGLIGSSTFDPWFEKMFDRSYDQVIGWGLGDNARIDTTSGYVAPGECVFPDYIKRFTLLGVRDYGTEQAWVPCASCLHPLFAEQWDIRNEVVVFEHKRIPIHIEGFPKMSNDTRDLPRVLQFLGTARVVITNSYHAAYWSQLLGKGVLAFPFSSKFYHLKHRITLCRPAEWKKHLDRVEGQPPALRECIEANLAFADKVRALVGWPLRLQGTAMCENIDLGESREPEPLAVDHHSRSCTALASGDSLPQSDLSSGLSGSVTSTTGEVKVQVPLAVGELDGFLAPLRPNDIVLVPDSEDQRFDALKLRLFEFDHVGRDPRTRKQTWRGATRQRSSCPVQGADVPTIISFYTVGTAYEAMANKLEASCRECGVSFVIEGVPSLGSWESNCAFKPRFILDKWRVLRRPVLWVDADALVRRPPGLLAGTAADFGIHKVDRWQFASGTVFFNQTENARRLLDCWVRRCDAAPTVWDQEHLDAAWEEVVDQYPLRTMWLPQSYTKIFDRAVEPGEDPLPVIEHFQASREMKRRISNASETAAHVFPPEFVAARAVSRPFRPVPEQASGSAAPLISDISLLTIQLAKFFSAQTLLQVDWSSRREATLCHFDSRNKSAPRQCVETDEIKPVLPCGDSSCDLVFNVTSLALVPDACLGGWLSELHRVTRRDLWVALETSPGRDRPWWEARFLEAGFRKHPLSQLRVPFETIESEGTTITLLFEKVPPQALERYSLAELKKERDLHMDMLREPGIRSDAHLARYTLARELLKPGMVVLDIACGLGYGSALMATNTGVARVIGVDSSEFAVEYAKANFGPSYPNVEFNTADAARLDFLEDASVDAVVSFETLEHMPDPEKLLCEIVRVLRPGGLVVASVPNLWLDENGNNPVPWHFQIYDFASFREQLARHFDLKQIYRQNAGGGWKRPQPRILRQIPDACPSMDDQKDAEWWIGVALKPAKAGREQTRRIWLLCSNSNHVKLLAPVARKLQSQGWKPTFVSLDNYYGQGSAQALRELGSEWLELPTVTPDGDWHERTQEQRQPWDAEATAATHAMFELNGPQVLVVGNDTGFLERLFIRTAESFGARTVLLQEGSLRSACINTATGEPATVMGDGGCELICTWGEGLASRLRARGVSAVIESVGNPLFDLPLPSRPIRNGDRDTVLLIGQCFGKYGEYSLDHEHAVYEKLIHAISRRERYRLIFKLHPQQDPSYYTGLHQRLGKSFELLAKGESLASIQSADLVVSVASTMALEAFRLGVPALTLHYLAPFEVPDLRRLPGGCVSEDEFHRYLDQPESWKSLRSNLESDEAITRDLLFKLDGKACERMAAAITRLVNTPAAKHPESSPVPISPFIHPEHAKKQMTSNQINPQAGPGWALLHEMYATKKAKDLTGKVHDLELAGVSLETGILLYNLVRQHRPEQTIETGFAYGFSTLFILQALSDNGGGSHEAIDPVETARWHGIGVANVRRAGFESMFTHVEMASQLVLPSHLLNALEINFAFVDGSHLFDETLLDAYYIDRMLAVGGIMVVDDWDWLPAVRSVTNFIESNLPYEVLPAPQAPKVRVLRKTGGSSRAWDHFVPFEVPSVAALKQNPFALPVPAAPRLTDKLHSLTAGLGGAALRSSIPGAAVGS